MRLFVGEFPELSVFLELTEKQEDLLSNAVVDKNRTVLLHFGGELYVFCRYPEDGSEVIEYLSLIRSPKCVIGQASWIDNYFPGNGIRLITAVYQNTERTRVFPVCIKKSIDFDEAKQIHKLLFADGLTVSFDEYYAGLRRAERRNESRIYCIKSGNTVVSSAATMKEGTKTAILSAVITAPEFRRQGYATSLVFELAADLVSEGIAKVCINYTEENAGRAYRKAGFVPSIERKIVYLGETDVH